jgi:hypothetical protein
MTDMHEMGLTITGDVRKEEKEQRKDKCPFHAGDVIVAASSLDSKLLMDGGQYMPGGTRLIVLGEDAAQAHCVSGWQLFGVDAGWFRLAMSSEVMAVVEGYLRHFQGRKERCHQLVYLIRELSSLLEAAATKE